MTSDDVANRFSSLCTQLGYVTSGNLLIPANLENERNVPHPVREAFKTIGVLAVFGMRDGSPSDRIKPLVYVAIARDDEEVLRLRRDVWTQGIVPFLLIVRPEDVLLCSGFEHPTRAAHVVRGAFLQDERLARLTAERLRSSITWRDFEISATSMVDNQLLEAIQELSNEVRRKNERLVRRADLVSALIGRFLYLYILIDRGIVTEGWLRKKADRRSGVTEFVRQVLSADRGVEEGRWDRKDAFTVFDALDEAINGSVFPIGDDDRDIIDDETCRLIHSVLRKGETLRSGTRQLSFFDVSYRIMRTETISALYERFVALQGVERKKDKGVFYTPPYLVDHVLDRIEETSPLTRNSTVVDPAAGSGIFLVGAFRRIMERNAPIGGWRPENRGEARSLLKSCIYGIEELPEAANVCRFSLYLTLLDYVGQAPIDVLSAEFDGEKFLPPLDRNIHAADAFTFPFGARTFTHVVGNPPWSQEGGQKDRSNRNTRDGQVNLALTAFGSTLNAKFEPVAHNRLADYFYWLGSRLAEKDGTLGYVMPARSLIGKHSDGFAKAVARKTTPTFVGNLAHLRRKLFVGAQAPACLVVARNRAAGGNDWVQVYRPLLSSLPLGKNFPIWILPTSPTDVQNLPVRDLGSGNAGWFEQAMLGTLDRRTLKALSVWTEVKDSTLSDFLHRARLVMRKGLGPNETGVPRASIGETTEQISSLSGEDLKRIPGRYRARFAGDVILLPRAPGQPARYLAEPHQFPTTFNVLLPLEYDRREDDPTSAEMREAEWREAVPGLLAFFRSNVLIYFASLYSPTYLMDKARFEREDLLKVPCPFIDLTDPRLLSLSAVDSADDAILDAIQAGVEFRAAFREFQDFRSKFGNAQVPDTAYEEANDTGLTDYLQRLETELKAAGGSMGASRCSAPQDTRRDGRRVVNVLFADADADSLPILPLGEFLMSSAFAVSEATDAAVVVKSTARHAWTIEQAVADAQVLREQVGRMQRMRRERVGR